MLAFVKSSRMYCESWFVPDGFARGHHGMNQCLRSLSCLLSVAAVALFATGASARGSHQQQHAKKTTAANKKRRQLNRPKRRRRKQRRRSIVAAAGKGRHGKQAAAQRKSKRSNEAPAEKEAAPALTGDLAKVKEAIDLARKGKTEDATAARNAIAIRRARGWSNGSSCATPRQRRISAAMRRSLPPTRNGRVWR